MGSAPTYTVFYGTFIDLPKTPSDDKHVLSIRHGALWVSTTDGRIQGADWTISSDAALTAFLRKKGWISHSDSKSGATAATTVKIIHAKEDKSEFFFPGFIDTHIHAPQHPNTGLFGSTTLLSWLEKYTFPMESSFGSTKLPSLPPPHAYHVYNQTIQRTLSNGTTFASYFATIHVPATQLLASLCHKRGQKALIGRVCMDNPSFCPEFYRDESAADSVAQNTEVISHIHAIDPTGALVAPILTPRFAPTCSEEAMRGVAEQARAFDPPLHIQTHISENKDEIATCEFVGGGAAGVFGVEAVKAYGRLVALGSKDSAVDVFGWESWEEKVHKWVWTGDDRNVRRVWVNGRLVHVREAEDDDGEKQSARVLRWVVAAGLVAVGVFGAVRRLKR
ncbi:hypothetical protein FE257_002674 [Aspergillus nanangensis]|uniref:Amidohydrolase-related domain-containing protein n=1 Tax=Aspergillus nanangensis TaxID=2582783 RepID=A0AAD4GP02_ASPNN|nr:hypothetical protein FE257_002674 [Aspergillus nanangensis]